MVGTFPIFLDLSAKKVALIGMGGERMHNRLLQLQRFGVKYLHVIDVSQGGALPDEAWIGAMDIVMSVDLAHEDAEHVAQMARNQRVWLNTEDDKPRCDFYFGSIVSRGDLSIGISTNGQSPALAQLIRRYLEVLFPESWAEYIEQLGGLRRAWQRDGVHPVEMGKRSRAHIAEHAPAPLRESIDV